ncbi:MAG TPA: hypothetical protein VK971_04605, partial [Thiohalobacter sp.]|nr:hypothetical protein [Thiohalobacter sp.]
LISSEAGTTRTITFSGDDSAIENITSTDTWYGGSYIGQFAAGTKVRITGTLTVQNITLTPVNDIRGGMFGYADLEIVGDVIDRNRSITVNDGKFNRALFIFSGNVSVPGSIDSADIQAIGGTSGCAVLHMTGPFNVNNVTGNRITVQQQAGQNSVGTLVLALGSAASGYVRRVEGNDLTGFSGGCVYFSGGANGLVESVIARRNRMGENGAGAYSGGDGDMTIISLYAIDCHAETLGGAFFAHNHPTSSTRNKTVKVINLTAINCTAANGGNAVYINSPNETYTMTSSIENAVIRGQATDNVAFGESGTSVHTATIDNSDIEGGASAITDGTTNGSVTATNIFDDGSQVNADGTLVPDSPYRTAGNYRRYGTRDANGRLFGLPMPIGALGPWSNPANTRTARA